MVRVNLRRKLFAFLRASASPRLNRKSEIVIRKLLNYALTRLPNSFLPHTIEKFFLDDLAVFDGVERGFLHIDTLAGHRTYLRRHFILEVHDEAVAMRPGSFGFGAMDLMVLDPPFALAFDRLQSLRPRRPRWIFMHFEAHDLRTIKGIDGFGCFALAA